MAPLCADPRQIAITLNLARRQALLQLVREITTYMISELQTRPDELGSVTPKDEGNEVDGTAGRGKKPPQDGRLQTSGRLPADKATRQAERVQRAALKYTLEWRDELLSKLGEVVNVPDSPKILSERKTRRKTLDQKQLDIPGCSDHLLDAGGMAVDRTEDVSGLQALYKPVPTRLTTIPPQDREEALSCVLILLLSTGKYSAHSRALILYLASSLELPQTFLNKEEAEIAKSLMESSTADKSQEEAMSADAEAAKRRQENKVSRFWKVGLASVAGAAVIGVTGGLAAPLVAGAIGGVLGGVGLGGVASFLGIFWMNGALVGALFGAYGAKMTGEMMDNYAKEVEDFRFLPLEEELDNEAQGDLSKEQKQQRRLRVTIGVNGWLNSEDDVKQPWRVLGPDTEVFALRYEMKILLALGSAFSDLMKSFAWQAFTQEVIKRTVLATLWAALWPLQILAVASNVDNPFNRASNRSQKAGQLLADALINKVQGERPVTLVGYSLGATTIHSCLQSLAERHAFGLVDTVVIIGTPAPSDPAHWRTIRPVVSGKIFNVYSENDMILGFAYRMHSLALGVAGLQPIEEVQGIENLNLSEKVSGHLRYASLTGEILRKCGFMSVKASDEIEKDDVIRMKDNYSEGDLIDFDGPATEGEPVDKMEDDLRGLTIVPPALMPDPEPTNPPLPRRPTQNTTLESQATKEPIPLLPRRPTQNATLESQPLLTEEPTPRLLPRRSTQDMSPTVPQQSQDNPSAFRRRPVPEPRQDTSSNVLHNPPRPLTPESNDSDDEEYMTIAMVDLDDDDDEDD